MVLGSVNGYLRFYPQILLKNQEFATAGKRFLETRSFSPAVAIS